MASFTRLGTSQTHGLYYGLVKKLLEYRTKDAEKMYCFTIFPSTAV